MNVWCLWAKEYIIFNITETNTERVGRAGLVVSIPASKSH